MQRKLDKISLYTFQKHFTVLFYSLENLTRWCNFTRNLNLQIDQNSFKYASKINRLQNIIYYSSGPACSSSNPAGLKPARPEGLPARAAQQPSRMRCSPPCPGRNLGLGREFVAPPGPHSARRIVAIHFDRTAMRDFRGIKTPPAGRPSPKP